MTAPVIVEGTGMPGGFKLRDVVEVRPYHYGAVFERRT